MTERLTTLAAVKQWLGLTGDDGSSDDQLTRLIDSASQFVLNWLNRDSFARTSYVMNFRGNGKDTMLLRNWPILSVASVGICGTAIAASVMGANGLPGSGYTIGDARVSAQSLDLHGYCFSYRSPCQVLYDAGFEATQLFTIAQVAGVVVPIIPNSAGQWTTNISVKTTAGATMTKVTTVPPAAGQYYVDPWGTYTFAVADAGLMVNITYSYAPWDVAFAVTECIGEWFQRKEHIGLISKTLGGQETMTFSQTDLSNMAISVLQSYANVVPI